YVYASSALSIIHSFPTRRSSDLAIVQIVIRDFVVKTHSHDPEFRSPKIKHYRQFRTPDVYSICPIFIERVSFYSLVGYSGPKFIDRKSTRLNSSHVSISYAVFCL